METAPLAASPLETAAFAERMAAFAPFEPAPRLAVAVSGGADSLALTLLADRWARERGGDVVALTVDHRLRPEAADEAAQVGRWLMARDIPHVTLVRDGPMLDGDVQATARAARYRLLEEWCADAGVLHLLTAHHREDQAETVLLRLARGSGVDGLAGMAGLVERRHCRLLRPLLDVPKASLLAFLADVGQPFIEDPSNRNPAYARARLRAGADLLAGEGLSPERLAATARHLGRARDALEAAVADCLARAVALDPLGFARLDPTVLISVPAEIGLRALAALLATIAGSDYPPRFERLETLHGALAAGLDAGRTIGGCRLLPRRDIVLVCREAAALAPSLPASPGARVRWDGRFEITFAPAAPAGLWVGALGADAASVAAVGAARGLPAAIRAGLPAIRDAAGVASVPGLGYARDPKEAAGWVLTAEFKPTRPLTRARFTVV